MFKCEFSTFVNEWGYNEEYIVKSLESKRTGHVYSGSSFETDDSCGNCDGGRCDSCVEIFTVRQYGEPNVVENEFGWEESHENLLSWRRFTNVDEALAFYESL